MKIALRINGKNVIIQSDPGLRLVEVLRNQFQLCSAKTGCLEGHCGSCMILLDNKPVSSCLVPVIAARNREIMTLEGFSQMETYQDIKTAFEQLNITLCGFCDSSKFLTAYHILNLFSRPTKEEIYEYIKSLECMCIDSEQFTSAILLAAAARRKKK